jgi:penicillin amidase
MRLVVRIVVLLAALAALAAAGMVLHLRRSLPVLEGEIAVAGLSGRVEILRDPYGIPHIFAASIEDAQLALGFAHAQDRLWQMEMNRRIGSGRLAEILGPRALEADRFLRTLGVRRVAEANLRRYDKETLALLQAYAAGVNAFLDSGPVLPPEFWLLRASPEPWTPADTVVWTKMMAWDLGGNWRNELLRLRMSKSMSRERVAEFFPPYPGDAAVKLPELVAGGGIGLAEKGPDPFFSLGFTGGAS